MNAFACVDCGVHTGDIDEYYMVHDYVWPIDRGMLCIGCLEARIGRQLTFHDFQLVPGHTVWKRSERLADRMRGFDKLYKIILDFVNSGK